MLKETLLSSFKNKLAALVLKKDLAHFAKKWIMPNTVVQCY